MKLSVTININGRPQTRGRAAPAARPFPARRRRPDRHQSRLRHQPVRRLHRAPGRRGGQVVHVPRGAGRRVQRDDDRRAGAGRHSSSAAGSVLGRSTGCSAASARRGWSSPRTKLLRTNPNPSAEQIRHGLEGNMCRCTGYQNIVRAVEAAAADPASRSSESRDDGNGHGHAARVFGSGIRRREDPRLLTGTARYTDDIVLPGHGARGDPAQPARARADPRHRHRRGQGGARRRRRLHRRRHRRRAAADSVRVAGAERRPEGRRRTAPIAKDVVRYVGDAVAVVVAGVGLPGVRRARSDRGRLRSAAGGRRSARRPWQTGAPQLHAEVPGNQSRSTGRSPAATSTRRSRTPTSSSRDRIVQQRLIPTAMETARRAWRSSSPATGELTLWNTTQNPHIVRFLMSLVTGVPEDRLRVIAPEVGGGFGSKIAADPGRLHHGVLLDEARAAGEVDRDALARTTSRRRTAAITCRTSSSRRRRTGKILGLRCHRLGRAWARTSRPRRPAFRRSFTA